jgi:hypothetical protein
MADVTNVKLGVCNVTYGGTDLGHTRGGCTVTLTPEYVDMTVDQYGNTPFNKALIGEDLRVMIPLAETQVANLKNAFPLGTLAGASDGRFTLGKDAGDKLLDEAKELVLHPIQNATGDLSDDVVIHKAVVDTEIAINYSNEEQTTVEVEFCALIDTTKSTGNYLGHIGDSTD